MARDAGKLRGVLVCLVLPVVLVGCTPAPGEMTAGGPMLGADPVNPLNQIAYADRPIELDQFRAQFEPGAGGNGGNGAGETQTKGAAGVPPPEVPPARPGTLVPMPTPPPRPVEPASVTPVVPIPGRTHTARDELETPVAPIPGRTHTARDELNSPLAPIPGRTHTARDELNSPLGPMDPRFDPDALTPTFSPGFRTGNTF